MPQILAADDDYSADTGKVKHRRKEMSCWSKCLVLTPSSFVMHISFFAEEYICSFLPPPSACMASHTLFPHIPSVCSVIYFEYLTVVSRNVVKPFDLLSLGVM